MHHRSYSSIAYCRIEQEQTMTPGRLSLARHEAPIATRYCIILDFKIQKWWRSKQSKDERPSPPSTSLLQTMFSVDEEGFHSIIEGTTVSVLSLPNMLKATR